MADPATWREAARQLREEADSFSTSDRNGVEYAIWYVLGSLARRFDNEAKAAESRRAVSVVIRATLPERWRSLGMRATNIRSLPGPAPESIVYYQCAADLEAAEEAKGET